MKNVSSIASLRGFTKKIISSYLDKYFENNLHLFIYETRRKRCVGIAQHKKDMTRSTKWV